MSATKGKVLLAMSGGVDSSVSAVLLREQGYEVVGCFMRLGSPGETLDELTPVGGDESAACHPKKLKLGHQGCCSVSDAADARLVAAQLGIPFYVVNFKKDFGRIMDYFADEYAAGRTPNPCVRCNDWLKFGKLREYAGQIGARFVASGHYARVERRTDEQTNSGGKAGAESGGSDWRLMRGLDTDKDQSYVLFGVPREHLGHMLLPVGGLCKSEVRRIAEEHRLPVFNKPDSQEICFVPDNDYAGFVGRRRPGLEREGDVLDAAGQVVGKHGGHHRFTIGQRRGVGVALGYPIFVTGKDPERNTVTVGPRESLLSEGCVAGEANWLAGETAPGEWTECWVKYRYNTEAVRGRVRREGTEMTNSPNRQIAKENGDGARSYSGRSGRFEVRFDSPQEAVTPGQAVVVYGGEAGDVVLGGGWIESSH
ncbi:MAG: tRNA 2-thiouridine(34) synthase MnmA [Phycisphaerales bacterium]